jgi:tRNA threonylcarbamoyl adenosine modification protein YeaZ
VLTLVLDTATPAVTAGLVDVAPDAAPRLVAERVVVEPQRHGEVLAPSIEAVISAAGATAAAIGAVVAGVGPGPFTGLRVGLVTAAAIGFARGIPTYAVCSLDAIAGAAAARPGAPADLLVATDARRREVYWAGYSGGRRNTGPAVDTPADVAAAVPDLGVTAMAGAGARQYAEVLGLPLLDADFPTVLELAALAADRILVGAPGETLEPLYLRRPDATPPAALRTVTQ